MTKKVLLRLDHWIPKSCVQAFCEDFLTEQQLKWGAHSLRAIRSGQLLTSEIQNLVQISSPGTPVPGVVCGCCGYVPRQLSHKTERS